MEDFLAFRRMLTPFLIQVAFWTLALGSVLFGIYVWRSQDDAAKGLAFIILGPLVARVWAEVVIILFAIHESLVDIRGFVLRQPPSSWIVSPAPGSPAPGASGGDPDATAEEESEWAFPQIEPGLAPLDLLDAVDVSAADLWDQVAIDHDVDLYEQRSEIEGDLDEYLRAATYLADALNNVTDRDHGGDATTALDGLAATLRAMREYISILKTIVPQTDATSVGSDLQAAEDRIDDAYARFRESILRLDPDYEPAFDSTAVA